jgi:predicted ATPase/DNA-binding SARP family transcriptional activator
VALLNLSLLGSPQVSLDGRVIQGFAYDKVQALLVYLVVESQHVHDRSALAALLWPEQSETVGRDNLRQTLSMLRRALGGPGHDCPFLLTTRETLQFNCSSDYVCDVAEFLTRLWACAHHRHDDLQNRICPVCTRELSAAADLYRGDFLAQFHVRGGVAFDEWVTLQREKFHLAAVESLEQLTRYHASSHNYAAACGYARRQLELDPWREDTYRLLIEMLWHNGERAAALAQYERCCQVLAAEFGVEPSEETVQLVACIRAGGKGEPAAMESPDSARGITLLAPAGEIQQGARPRTNLPSPPTPLVGRNPELAATRALLHQDALHLITITGAPGIGKTRFALELASEILGEFADGVFFVPLAEVRDPELLPSALAAELRIREMPGQSLLQTLKDHLHSRQVLLLFDNFEQITPAAGMLAELLASAPRLKVLVTSRALLQLRGEKSVRLLPLALPDPRVALSTEELLQVASVALFVARAQDAQRDFELMPTDAPVVAAICRRLEGVPLAIELAASRMRILSPQVLLKRMDDRLTWLGGGPQDLPVRQRTLRQLLDWSFDLLTSGEQRLLRQLVMHTGGCSYETALESCRNAENEESELLEQLTALVDKSLVYRESRGGEVNFTVLGMIREYTMEKILL